MSIKTGIDETRKQYENRIFGILKNREQSKQTELRLWPMLELANSRGFYLVDSLLSRIDSSERVIDARGILNALFDFISPIEAYILLTGTSFLNQSDSAAVEVLSSGAYEPLDPNRITGNQYNKPSEKVFSVGKVVDEFDPQYARDNEPLKTQRDYEVVQNRRQLWRNDCSVIFDAVWSTSKLWGNLLNLGFKNVSDLRFEDDGIDFISDILVKAESRGFLYKNFFINEMPVSGKELELSDRFALAILLFVSPAELFQMLDINLGFAKAKYAKSKDPLLVKLAD